MLINLGVILSLLLWCFVVDDFLQGCVAVGYADAINIFISAKLGETVSKVMQLC